MTKTEVKKQMRDVKKTASELDAAPLFQQPALARKMLAKTIVIIDELIERMEDGE